MTAGVFASINVESSPVMGVTLTVTSAVSHTGVEEVSQISYSNVSMPENPGLGV